MHCIACDHDYDLGSNIQADHENQLKIGLNNDSYSCSPFLAIDATSGIGWYD